MAMKTFQYRFQGPTMAQLEEVCMGTISGTQPSVLITRDVTFDDTVTDGEDLTQAMSERGWQFVADVTP